MLVAVVWCTVVSLAGASVGELVGEEQVARLASWAARARRRVVFMVSEFVDEELVARLASWAARARRRVVVMVREARRGADIRTANKNWVGPFLVWRGISQQQSNIFQRSHQNQRGQ